MKTSAEMYGKYMKDYMINDDQIKEVQSAGAKMLHDLHTICENNNLKYAIIFGTLLGAVRHSGYIPWDDDIDVIMTREDYLRLVSVINKNHSEEYEILDSTMDKTFNLPFAKLYKKGTILVEAAVEVKGSKKGLYIDIFLLEKAPDEKKIAKMKSKYLLYNRLASLSCDFKFPSTSIISKSKSAPELKKYYRQRRMMGMIASIFPISMYTRLVRNLVAKGHREDAYMLAGDVYRPFKKDYFDNLQLMQFEEFQIYGLADYDGFLTSVYGDYMQLPPEEKRERHIIIELDLGVKEIDICKQ